MKPTLLPGLRVIKASVFDLSIGTRILDKATNTLGIISDIRETTPENVEAFILIDGETQEANVSSFPQAVILKEGA